MKTLDLVDKARDQFLSLDHSTTLVILHPDFYGQHTLLAPLLDRTDQHTVFLSVPKSGADLDTLTVALSEAIRTQLDESISDLPAEPEAAANAIAEVMNAHSPVNMVIDGYDLLEPDSTGDLLAALATRLTGGSRVVIGGLQLPMDLLWRENL